MASPTSPFPLLSFSRCPPRRIYLPFSPFNLFQTPARHYSRFVSLVEDPRIPSQKKTNPRGHIRCSIPSCREGPLHSRPWPRQKRTHAPTACFVSSNCLFLAGPCCVWLVALSASPGLDHIRHIHTCARHPALFVHPVLALESLFPLLIFALSLCLALPPSLSLGCHLTTPPPLLSTQSGHGFSIPLSESCRRYVGIRQRPAQTPRCRLGRHQPAEPIQRHG